MSFEITSERVGSVLVLGVEGELLLSQKLRVSSAHVRGAGDATAVLVDLESCTRVDSAGLGELLMWYSLAARDGRKMMLCGATERIRQIIKIARVDGILLHARDREAGLAELGRD